MKLKIIEIITDSTKWIEICIVSCVQVLLCKVFPEEIES